MRRPWPLLLLPALVAWSRVPRMTRAAERQELRELRAREIKAVPWRLASELFLSGLFSLAAKELQSAGVDVSDIFDKEELVERLYQLRSGQLTPPPAEPAPSAPAAAAAAVDFVARCRGLSVLELRTELGSRGVSWADCLEKDELVQRLARILEKEAAFCSSGRLKPGLVTKLTGQELEEELKDDTTPLLLDVYATWCGPCT